MLAISIDGLNPDALKRLGRDGAPAIWRLIDHGVHTFDARASVELTDTLPNHTSMVTGRAIERDRNGHGVTWNDERRDPATVQEAAGEDVGSVFAEVGDAGRSSALFTTKEKLRLFGRSWSAALDKVAVQYRDETLADAARKDLVRHHRAFTFVHLGGADAAGHANGFMSPEYIDTVGRLDGLVGRLEHAVRHRPQLEGTAIVLTADHGGRGESHREPEKRANYRVPFVVWGPQVGTGDLYDLQGRAYADPGREQVGYGARRQPVRNGDVANLSLDLLGLGAVPDSRFDDKQDLRVR
ncbi:Type I phosphodiesterase / nucleotide pyrophosphatase [Nocardioides sp. AX2bis]|nr:Type I phosphodiesterase / nucleotide pyrophosphatase [Nocardioides sp. AX2bis]